MADILRAILIMSASGSGLALLLFVLKSLGRHRLPKSTQYYLWLVVIAALLIPVSRLVVLPDSQAPVVQNLPTINDTVTRFVITQAEETQRLESIAPLSAINPPAYASQLQEMQSPIALITTYFVLIYPFGVVILLIYYAIHYAIFVGLYRRRNRKAPPGAQALLASMCGGKPPRLFYNQLAETPMLFGILRPAIILPYQEYTRDEMQIILSHELTHLRRKDVLVKWLTLIATALHWFNPIVWLVSREIDRACELSCDEAVIRSMDNQGRRHYGNTLILVAANPKIPRAITSATMSEDKKNLKERLGAIMKSKRSAWYVKKPWYVLIISALLIVVAVGMAACLGSGSQSPPIVREYPGETDVDYPDDTPDGQYPGYGDTTSQATELNLQMAPAADAPLDNLGSIHEVDYREAHLAYWGGDLSWLTINAPAAIWANVPLHNFQIIGIYLGHSDSGVTATATHAYYEVDVLDGPLVINWFFTAGLFPNNGISFIDAEGVRRLYAIQAGYGYEGDAPFTLIEFEDGGYIFRWDTDESSGSGEADGYSGDNSDAEGNADTLEESGYQSVFAGTNLVWTVPPTLEYESVRRCNCGRFLNQDWRVIDPVSGHLTGDIDGGHGGAPPCWVYDPALGLFGSPGFDFGYHSLVGMHPMAEFEANMDWWDLQHSSGLIAVQRVDSTQRHLLRDYVEMYDDPDYAQDWWALSQEAYTGQFAVMYNRRLVTDFVFSGGAPWWNKFMMDDYLTVSFTDVDFIPMEMGGNWGLIGRSGNDVLPFIFENFVAIDSRVAFARVNGRYGILDVRATIASN